MIFSSCRPRSTKEAVSSDKMATPPVASNLSVSKNTPGSSHIQRVALPLHVQKLHRALNLDRFIDQVEQVFNESLSLDKTVRYW